MYKIVTSLLLRLGCGKHMCNHTQTHTKSSSIDPTSKAGFQQRSPQPRPHGSTDPAELVSPVLQLVVSQPVCTVINGNGFLFAKTHVAQCQAEQRANNELQ